MQQDYSSYSISELREALAGVDGNKYPENKAAIEAELKTRRDAGELALLGSQLLRIQTESFVFSFLSAVGIYAFYSQGGDIGLSAEFEPAVVISVGSGGALWIGVNLVVVVLLYFLSTAREEVE